MGTETDTNSSNSSEIQPLAEFDPNKEQVGELDERDVIEPLKKPTVDTDDQEQANESDTPEGMAAEEQEIPLDGVYGQVESDAPEATDDAGDKSEIHLEKSDGEVEEPDSDEKEISLAAAPGDPDGDGGAGSENETKDSESGGDGDSPDNEEPSAGGGQKEPTENTDDGAVAEDEVKDSDPDGDEKQDKTSEDPAKNGTVSNKDRGQIKKIAKKKEPLPKSTADSQKEKKSVKDATPSKKIIVSIIIIFMVMGAVIYSRPALFGLQEKPEDALAAKPEISIPAKQTEIQTRKPAPPGKNDRYLSKLEDVDRLREELLAKKEEIYRLKLHYLNGIVELKALIGQEMQDANISSFTQAVKNKRIELNLRTIQRRQVYIQELEKPDQWVHNGSEELLFLKRKALLDLQMTDIASGIDLDRHMRYMNAAIQKYQPSADNLAVDPPPAEIAPLETIWHQILTQQAENVQVPVGQADEQIIADVCSGNFRRIAELTAITPQAARCLARMNGSDLFLNGLTQLTPKEAKYLFKWKGNWICLNSVKTLSPTVAKYLFKWQGNWISLNGLTKFPPELALYLMEWKGNQLELMGLNYENSKLNKRALKYLALWETMGGKLFVSEDVRNEMKRVM